MPNFPAMEPRPIAFAPPPIDEDSIAAVVRVLRSGWITSGPELAALEEEVDAWIREAEPDGHGRERCICLSSWTTACELALRWWGVGPGDEVIVPAITYAATANIVLHCGATPVLVDVGSDGTVTAAAVAEAMTERTKVVMPVDLGGWPADLANIRAAVEAARSLFRPATETQERLGRALVLADAAHAFGGRIGGRRVGLQADLTGFSFHAVKNFTTAEGGALYLNLPPSFDPAEIARWIRIHSLHGQTRDAFSKTTGTSWHYDIVAAGYKCNMTDLQAALGRAQLPKYADQLARRQALAERYTAGLAGDPRFTLPPLHDGTRLSAFHLYPLRLRGCTPERRDAFIDALRAEQIATNVHFIPLPELTVHRERGERLDRYPGAAAWFSEEVSLPLHLALSDADVDRVIAAVLRWAPAAP